MRKWKFAISNSLYRTGSIIMKRTEGNPRFGYEPIYIDRDKPTILMSYCLENNIEITEGIDFIFKDMGGKWVETTYDQPDRYISNNQPVFTEEFVKSLIRDIKIKKLLD